MIPVQYRISTSQQISPLQHVKIALNSGCKWIQLEVKEADQIDLDTLNQIKDLCRAQEATFIIEDHIDLVKAIDGDGVHITTDTSVMEVRQQLGEGFLIGANAKDKEDIVRKKQQSADYICYGPYNTSNTGVTIDLQNYKETISYTEDKGVFLPICAYGKILPNEVLPIIETGMRGISICIETNEINEDLITTTLNQYLSL